MPADGRCPSCARLLVAPTPGGKTKPAWRTGERGTPGGSSGGAGEEVGDKAGGARGDAPDDGEIPDGWHPNDINTDIPWHFWLFVAALVIYLGWRLIQLVQWLVG